MASSEITTENLLARLERNLATDERRISALQGKEDLTKRQRTILDQSRLRKERTLKARTRLTELSSGLTQKERFGLNRWNREFQRVSEIKSDQTTNPHGFKVTDKELQDRVIAAMGRTPFLRFQRTFCKPRDFIAPKFELGRDGHIRFLYVRPDQMAKLSVAPCLVSPDMISKSVIESLQLHKFTEEEQKSPLDLLARKAKPEIIDTIKVLFDCAVFPASPRVLVLRRPSAQEQANYPRAQRLKEGLPGTILYFRHKVDEDTPRAKRRTDTWRVNPPLFVQHFPTVFKAYRRALHSGSGYAQEYQGLVSVIADLTNLQSRISGGWPLFLTLRVEKEARPAHLFLIRQGF